MNKDKIRKAIEDTLNDWVNNDKPGAVDRMVNAIEYEFDKDNHELHCALNENMRLKLELGELQEGKISKVYEWEKPINEWLAARRLNQIEINFDRYGIANTKELVWTENEKTRPIRELVKDHFRSELKKFAEDICKPITAVEANIIGHDTLTQQKIKIALKQRGIE